MRAETIVHIQAVRGHTPQFGSGVFVAPTASIVGEVYLGAESSIWYQAVLRGDVAPIRIGARTNIQDGSVLHGTYGKHSVSIGEDVTIGHMVMAHGCEIGNGCLIGMQSVILDGSSIGDFCLVGAGSLILEGAKFEGGQLIVGRPAKAIRPLRQEEIDRLKQSAKNYLHYMTWYS